MWVLRSLWQRKFVPLDVRNSSVAHDGIDTSCRMSVSFATCCPNASS